MSRVVVLLLRALIRLHQLVISPLLGPACRYAPSCSEYAHEALGCHGPLHGLILTVRRVASCHPWSEGGYDPVPDGTHLRPPLRVFPWSRG